MECSIERGVHVSGETATEDDFCDSDDQFEEDDVFGEEIDDELEQNELRSDIVLEVIRTGDVIALFSSTNSLELFYICRVLSFGKAESDMVDENNHQILQGSPYIKVTYFEKKPLNSKKTCICPSSTSDVPTIKCEFYWL